MSQRAALQASSSVRRNANSGEPQFLITIRPTRLREDAVENQAGNDAAVNRITSEFIPDDDATLIFHERNN